jgi:hypothetical protein
MNTWGPWQGLQGSKERERQAERELEQVRNEVYNTAKKNYYVDRL